MVPVRVLDPTRVNDPVPPVSARVELARVTALPVSVAPLWLKVPLDMLRAPLTAMVEPALAVKDAPLWSTTPPAPTPSVPPEPFVNDDPLMKPRPTPAPT